MCFGPAARIVPSFECLTEIVTPLAPAADVLAAGVVVAAVFAAAAADVVPDLLLLPQPAARATAAATQPSINGFLTKTS